MIPYPPRGSSLDGYTLVKTDEGNDGDGGFVERTQGEARRDQFKWTATSSFSSIASNDNSISSSPWYIQKNDTLGAIVEDIGSVDEEALYASLIEQGFTEEELRDRFEEEKKKKEQELRDRYEEEKKIKEQELKERLEAEKKIKEQELKDRLQNEKPAFDVVTKRDVLFSSFGIIIGFVMVIAQMLSSKTSGVGPMCAAGNYLVVNGFNQEIMALEFDCMPCSVGRFLAIQDSAVCQDCAAGSYQNEIGKSRCMLCEAGKYQSAIGSSVCVECLGGTYQSLEASTADCLECLAGQYSGVGAVTCTECEAGKFQSLSAAAECLRCTSESAQTVGAVTCTCSPGYFEASTNNCEMCISGKYSADIGSLNCAECTQDTFSSHGAATCSFCGEGEFSLIGSSSCTSCPAGKYKPLSFLGRDRSRRLRDQNHHGLVLGMLKVISPSVINIHHRRLRAHDAGTNLPARNT